MSQDIYIGYWSHEKDPPNMDYNGQILPFPVEDSATQNQSEVIAKLKHAYETLYLERYRGWSTCRLCGRKNGTAELEIIRGNIKYRIPEGYVHYLEFHNVAYDPLLLELI